VSLAVLVELQLATDRQTDGHTHGTTVYTARSSLARLKCIFAYRIVKGFLLKGKGSPYSITERRVPELIPVLGSQPAGDVSHKPGGRLPLLSARPAVTPQPLRRLLPVSLLGEQRHDRCEQFA